MEDSKSREIMGAISECFFDSFSSRLLVRGWFLGPEVDKIEILLNDEENMGQAILNLERADILEKYPHYDNPRSGWLFKENIDQVLKKMKVCVRVYSSGAMVKRYESALKVLSNYSSGVIEVSSQSKGEDCFHEKELNRQTSNLINKLLFNVSVLSSEDIGRCLESDELFAIGMYSRNPDLMNALSQRYQIPAAVLDRLFSEDLRNWTSSIKNKTIRKVLTLREQTLLRMRVCQQNNVAFRNMLEILDVSRNSFLDVGCQYGYLLVSAALAGFKKVVGVEILPYYNDFASRLQEIVSNECGTQFSYYIGDFGELDFGMDKFTLITCIDVLEHSPDFKKTINTMIRFLSPEGIIYVSQGNGGSLITASNEPHYHIPCLSILPRQLALKVLRHLGKVNEKLTYVVEFWPNLDQIIECCNENNVQIDILNDDRRNNAKYPNVSELKRYISIFENQCSEKLIPYLSQSIREEVQLYIDEYLEKLDSDLRSLKPLEMKQKYLMGSWNIVIKRRLKH